MYVSSSPPRGIISPGMAKAIAKAGCICERPIPSIDLRHRPAQDEANEGSRLANRLLDDGLQARSGCRKEVEKAQRISTPRRHRPRCSIPRRNQDRRMTLDRNSSTGFGHISCGGRGACVCDVDVATIGAAEQYDERDRECGEVMKHEVLLQSNPLDFVERGLLVPTIFLSPKKTPARSFVPPPTSLFERGLHKESEHDASIVHTQRGIFLDRFPHFGG